MGIYGIDANRVFDRWVNALEEIEEKDKEIDQLRKENEWLLNELLPVYVRDIPGIHKPEITDESLKDLIIKQMNETLGG